MEYASQLQAKEKTIRDALAFLNPPALEKSVPSERTGFRNRAKMLVSGSSANPVVGLLGEEELDQGREILDCAIHHPRLNQLIGAMPALIRERLLEPYRIKERRGELKGLIAYYSPLSRQLYLRFVLRSKADLSKVQAMLPSLQTAFPDLVCISANIQPIPHAILEGPEEIFLTERESIDHQVGSFLVKLAPQAFVQTNFEVASCLYETAALWIGQARPSKMLELFCGQGLFSFFAHKSVCEALGIELNPRAVQAAVETASDLGIANLAFKSMDASKVSEEVRRYAPNLVLANPPRKGMGQGIELILESRPEQFIYSSCSIESLAADLRKLSDGYRVERVQLFDMFPHTPHFETLVGLKRK
jgi:23S rRNA (uracil747-C5)-methyltransferase